MKVLQGEGKFEIFTPVEVLQGYVLMIEKAGRTCYKSETGPITTETASKFIGMLIQRGHFSVLEHTYLTVKFMNVSRGLTHELVRHRLMAISQESTRYVDYVRGDDNPNLERFQCHFVLPPHRDLNQKVLVSEGELMSANEMLLKIESYYRALRKAGWIPEDARQLLPNALTSEIVVSANFREWRHIFYMRTAKAAHWEIRAVMIPLLDKLQSLIPIIFDDFKKAGEDVNGLPFYTCTNKDDK